MGAGFIDLQPAVPMFALREPRARARFAQAHTGSFFIET
jgi:hypothetical protein